MKKQVCWLMAVVMLISCFAFPAFAVAPQEENATPAPQVGDPIYLVDGTTITIGPIKKIETRGYIMYLERPITVGDGYEEYCRFTLIARFLVNDNNTITCISSLYDISISDLVGVVLDTLQQVESHLLMRHYDGLLKSGRIKGRSGVSAY